MSLAATHSMNRALETSSPVAPLTLRSRGAGTTRVKPPLWPAARIADGGDRKLPACTEQSRGGARDGVFPMIVAFGAESFQG